MENDKLEWLNNLLIEKQQEIKDAINFYEQILKSRNISVYELGFQLDYYGNDDNEKELYTYKGLLSDYFFNESIDWHEGASFPKLSQPYCYLFHDLCYHSGLSEKINLINTVWVDIIITEQQKINYKNNL
jgi:hypothetical protein